ncbi:MAG: glycosyltransferase family 4 protein [Alphaproteobacteria bacterium]
MTATTPTNGGMGERSNGAIVQVSDYLEAGPVNRVALDLAAAIQRFGGQSKIISGGGHMVAEAQRASVEHETVTLSSANPIGNPSGKIVSKLGEWGAQLVHSHGEDAAGHVLKAVGKHHVPHVVSLYDLPVQRNGKPTPGLRNALKADRVLLASPFLKNLLAEAGYLDGVNASVVPPGLAVNALHPSVVTAARLTRMVRDMEITAQSPVVLFPAALQEGAGHDIVIDALKQHQDQTWVCLFIGVGQAERRYHYKLNQRLEAEGLERRIKVYEGTEDPATLYKLTDIVISTVNGNLAFDYACAESQAAGKIVLGANNGATAFQIEPGTTGALFDPGDAETLSMALGWAMTMEPDRRAELENNAMLHAFKTYKRDETARQIFDIYDELLA